MDESLNSAGLTAEMEERRAMPRCEVDAAVTLFVLSRGTMLAGRLTELSLSGFRVSLPRIPPQAELAAVECTFKIRGVGFRLGGIVEWAGDNLAGVQFRAMSARSRDDLVEVLCEVELENSAKRGIGSDTPAGTARAAQATSGAFGLKTPQAAQPLVKPAAAIQAAPQALVEIVLEDTPRDTTRTAPTEPTSQGSKQTPLQTSSQPPHGRDRRASHRCDVDTSAIIELVKVGSRLSGHIVDLSVGGCRVRMDDKFPVGIYTRIETEFRLHGLPFRLGGVIQAIYDHNMVGIRFLDMSQRKLEQVAELIAEIEESQGE